MKKVLWNGVRAFVSIIACCVLVSVVLIAGLYLMVYQAMMRSINGACPMEHCSGWKVLYRTTPVEGGEIRTWVCSNDGGTDEDPGCSWYEMESVPEGDQELDVKFHVETAGRTGSSAT